MRGQAYSVLVNRPLGRWLASAAAMVRRWPSSFIQPRHVPVLVLLAHALGLMLFTLEARTFFAHYDNLATSHLARQMTYSIGYPLYACTLLAVGFLRRQAYLRAAGHTVEIYERGSISTPQDLRDARRVTSEDH